MGVPAGFGRKSSDPSAGQPGASDTLEKRMEDNGVRIRIPENDRLNELLRRAGFARPAAAHYASAEAVRPDEAYAAGRRRKAHRAFLLAVGLRAHAAWPDDVGPIGRRSGRRPHRARARAASRDSSAPGNRLLQPGALRDS